MNRKILIIISALALIVGLSGCEDYLDKEPDDMLTKEMVFNQKTRVEEWLAGLYSDIMDSYMDNIERHSFMMLGDEVTVPTELEQFRIWSIGAVQGNWNPTTNTRVDIWGNCYRAVRQAYIFLENVKPIPEQRLYQSDVDMMKLEARFLIAYYYQQMLEVFGPFPLVKSLVPSNAETSELFMQRNSYDEILNFIDQEYEALINQLPAELENPSFNFGKPTKGVVLACRARLWLFAASPLFNGNPDYIDAVNQDGSKLFSQQYDANRWEKAARYHNELIQLAETGVYDLYKEYYDDARTVIDPFMSCQNLHLTSADVNKEIIFARPRPSDLDWAYYDKLCFPRGMGGFGPFAVTQQMVDAFYMKDGKTIEASPLYSETGLSSAAVFYPNTRWDQSDANRTKGLVTPSRVFNMYVNREPRFYVAVRFNEQYVPAGKRNCDFFLDGRDGRPSFDTPPTGMMARKRVNPDFNLSNGRSPYRPSVLIRLAEVYLNYVEALNESDPGNPDIVFYLNKIRERAGIPTFGSAPDQLAVPSNQDQMREIIRHERHVELCMEGNRYHDIRRWKIAMDVFKDPIAGMNIYKTANQKAQFYVRTPYLQYVFKKKNYLWPIPQSVLDKNSKIIQNPFWDKDE